MTIRWVTRTDLGWGATAAAAAACADGLVLHYDGSNQGLAGKPHSACLAYWNGVRTYHMKTNGWLDIGYSYGACPHGYVIEGRGLKRQQAAQPGGNTTWHSVTLMGGPGDAVTDAQRVAVIELHDYLTTKGVARAQKGHRDFKATACPGDTIYSMLRAGRFAPGTAPKPAPVTEDTMTTSAEIAKAVWEYGIPNRYRLDADGQPRLIPARALQAAEDGHYDTIRAAVGAIASQLGALQGTVAALVGAVGSAGDISAEQVQAAAEAGATAALEKLGTALAGGE